MESGIIFDVQNLSLHDGPGLRTTVFFKGCPLRCLWCSNPESQNPNKEIMFYDEKCVKCGACEKVCPTGATVSRSKCIGCGRCVDVCLHGARVMAGRTVSSQDVVDEVLKDKIFYDNSGGGVTFSGGEVLMQPQFLIEILKLLKNENIHTIIDTTAYCDPEIFKEVIKYVDLVYVDIKCIENDLHKKLTGVSNDWILKNIKIMDDFGCKFDIRMPIIPGYNDDEDLIAKTIEFIKQLRSHPKIWLLPFHAYGKAKYSRIGLNWSMGDLPNLERSQLEPILKQFISVNLDAEIQ